MSTIEKINEQIEVLVAYTKRKVVPLAFSWKNKKYSVKNVNFVHAKYEGRNKFYFYSVSTGLDYFKLIFNTEKNEWLLNEAFYGQ